MSNVIKFPAKIDRSKTEYELRTQRIRCSLDKINKLMSELKKLSNEGETNA